MARTSLPFVAVIVLLGLGIIATAVATGSSARNHDEDADAMSRRGGTPWWPNWGGGLDNTHHAAFERRIAPCNAPSLTPVWTKTMVGDVAAPPAVDADGTLYVPDLGGYIWALNGATGATKWRAAVGNFTGNYGTFNPDLGRTFGSAPRGTPAISGGAIYFGDVNSAHVFGVDKRTGTLLWATLVEAHPAAVVTMAPTVFGGLVLVGVSSKEEQWAGRPDYVCCTFRGSMLALDARTGAIVWKTYMTVEGYAGAGVWGSSPSIDVTKGLVFVATGNNYKVPPDVQACVDAHGGDASACASDPDNLAEAVVALDLGTGAIAWNLSFSHQSGVDVWNIGCQPWLLGLPGGPNANCPEYPGVDADFAQAPMNIYYRSGSKRVPLLGVGQKNGFFFAIDKKDWSVAWVTVAGAGGSIGGLEWGSAFDGDRIYVAVANSDGANQTLLDGRVTRGGSWLALDPATGSVLWQTPVPEGVALAEANATDEEVAAAWPLAWSALTVANGVLYASTGSRDPTTPTLFALDAATGAIIWEYAPGWATNSAPTVVDGTVYWGTGYGLMSTPGHTFYAFRPAVAAC
jgi:polyvinyl alcohol dehydrogenase (cytochrome)